MQANKTLKTEFASPQRGRRGMNRQVRAFLPSESFWRVANPVSSIVRLPSLSKLF